MSKYQYNFDIRQSPVDQKFRVWVKMAVKDLAQRQSDISSFKMNPNGDVWVVVAVHEKHPVAISMAKEVLQ